jgi:hypothetical protein
VLFVASRQLVTAFGGVDLEIAMNSQLAYHANAARIEALVRLRPRTAC